MKYGFYPGCTYESAAGYKESVEAVNRVLGIDFIDIQDWTCCGATTFFSTSQDEALALTARIMALAEARGFHEMITVCNACYTTLRKAYKIFSHEPEKISLINQRLNSENLNLTQPVPIRHYLEVLCHDVPQDAWLQNLPDKYKDLKVAAYYGCQLTRPWGDVDHPEQPTMLDDFITRLGFTAVKHSAKTLCCGASHAVPYAKESKPLISRILREIKTKGGDLVTTICPLCQFNLDAGQTGENNFSLPVTYFSQLAGLALGVAPEKLGINKLLVSMKEVLK